MPILHPSSFSTNLGIWLQTLSSSMQKDQPGLNFARLSNRYPLRILARMKRMPATIPNTTFSNSPFTKKNDEQPWLSPFESARSSDGEWRVVIPSSHPRRWLFYTTKPFLAISKCLRQCLLVVASTKEAITIYQQYRQKKCYTTRSFLAISTCRWHCLLVASTGEAFTIY